jgi:hypothetical protein
VVAHQGLPPLPGPGGQRAGLHAVRQNEEGKKTLSFDSLALVSIHFLISSLLLFFHLHTHSKGQITDEMLFGKKGKSLPPQ